MTNCSTRVSVVPVISFLTIIGGIHVPLGTTHPRTRLLQPLERGVEVARDMLALVGQSDIDMIKYHSFIFTDRNAPSKWLVKYREWYISKDDFNKVIVDLNTRHYIAI